MGEDPKKVIADRNKKIMNKEKIITRVFKVP
jgi:hypothetical protein